MIRSHRARPVRLAATSASVVAAAALALTCTPAALGGVVARSHADTARPWSLRHPKMSARQILRLSANPDDRVIVILRDQPAGRPAAGSPRPALALAQRDAVVSELRLLDAPRVHAFSVLNAVSATVSRAEAARLSRNPAVRAVVPDQRVTLPEPGAEARAAASATATEPNDEPGVCPSSGSLAEPEALSLMHADDVGGIDGTGVKIAVFPDGLDPTIPDFMRGTTSVIGDYRDFTGEGTAARTGGGEAFGDVSSIAAQGVTAYDLSQYVNPALPLPSPCMITVTGAAPGATVDVMKVFGSTDATFDSVLLQGLDWAVTHDHVNVLSESFGETTVAQPRNDPISLFNAAAVKRGVTVVASSGDSGTSNTIGAPASSTQPGVISVGATTALQTSAQIGLYGAPVSACFTGSCGDPDQGWEDDNVASLSSAGVTEYGPATVDVVAPGDSGWADCSPKVTTYVECRDPFRAGSGTPPPIQLFGGTSESAPLTAATAALVIQAYEQTHGGAAPGPALVKRIIASSATPLSGVPADEQGAGLVDSAAAVSLAEVAAGGSGSPPANPLVVGGDQVARTGMPGGHGTVTLAVTNDGTAPATVTPSVVRLNGTTTSAAATFTFPGSTTVKTPDPVTGASTRTVVKSFTVPAGIARVVVRSAWSQSGRDLERTMEAALIDPDGRIVNGTDPQGLAGFGQIEAADPEPGTWHVAFDPDGSGYTGPVRWGVTMQRSATTAGTPVVIGAGSTGHVTVPYTLPAHPGDGSAAIELRTSPDAASQVALLTRARIAVTRHRAGHLSGTLTGGNGRQFLGSEELTYLFTVPHHAPAINANLTIARRGYYALASLVDPHGGVVDSQSDIFLTRGGGERDLRTIHLSWARPGAGTWHLVVTPFDSTFSGLTSAGLSGRVDFRSNPVKRHGLPDSGRARLRRGRTVPAAVTITNRGNSPESFFLDPRLDRSSAIALQPLRSTTGSLPIRYASANPFPVFVLPPFATAMAVVAKTARPAYLETFATDPSFGDEGYPDVVSSRASKTPAVSLRGGALGSTGYACAPQLAATFTTATRTGFRCGAAARISALTGDLKPATGDLWATSGPFRPVTVAPGHRTTIRLSIRPRERRGRLVKGFVAVEAFGEVSFGTDVLARLPFAFRVR